MSCIGQGRFQHKQLEVCNFTLCACQDPNSAQGLNLKRFQATITWCSLHVGFYNPSTSIKTCLSLDLLRLTLLSTPYDYKEDVTNTIICGNMVINYIWYMVQIQAKSLYKYFSCVFKYITRALQHKTKHTNSVQQFHNLIVFYNKQICILSKNLHTWGFPSSKYIF